MVCAKNYETTSTFVIVIQRKLLASFSGHGAQLYNRCVVSEVHDQ